MHTKARAEAQEDVRNFACFASVLGAFCSASPVNHILFSMSDIVAVEIRERSHDGFAFSVITGGSHVVFENKLPFTLKFDLTHFFNGAFADPLVLISDRSLPDGLVLPLENIPGLSPYPGGVGHVYVVNPSAGGMQAYFRLAWKQKFDAHAKQRVLFQLPDSCPGLHMTDGELPQIQTATEPAILERASQENVALGKGSASLSHLNSACDKGRCILQSRRWRASSRAERRPFRWTSACSRLSEPYAEVKKKWLPSSTRRQKRSLTRSGHAVCLSCASESTLAMQRK